MHVHTLHTQQHMHTHTTHTAPSAPVSAPMSFLCARTRTSHCKPCGLLGIKSLQPQAERVLLTALQEQARGHATATQGTQEKQMESSRGLGVHRPGLLLHSQWGSLSRRASDFSRTQQRHYCAASEGQGAAEMGSRCHVHLGREACSRADGWSSPHLHPPAQAGLTQLPTGPRSETAFDDHGVITTCTHV